MHGGVVHRLAVLHFQHDDGLGRGTGLVHSELAGHTVEVHAGHGVAHILTSGFLPAFSMACLSM